MNLIRKIILISFYILIILFGVTFAVSNRTRIDLTFFPLPYTFSTPLFLFTIIIFTIGIFIGWTLSYFKTFKYRRSHKDANRRVLALENEIAALRSEQHLKPAHTFAIK